MRRSHKFALQAIAVSAAAWLFTAIRGSHAPSKQASPDATPPAESSSTSPLERSSVAPHPALAATDPPVLAAAEARGLSLGAVLHAKATEALDTHRLYAGSSAYHDVVETLRRDLAELNARPRIGEGPDFGNHPFRSSWLTHARTRFELIGAIDRLDRNTGEPSRACGELRLVYRLAADPESRPTTRLPMTLNVLFPQPMPAQGGCTVLARPWASLPADGADRVRGLIAIFAGRSFDQIEVNLQNLHGPSLRQDMDDHAEYVLRAFDADERGAKPRRLFNTPRTDLDAVGRARLLAFVRDRFDAIDEGTWVVPADLLAERVVSVTPRGLERTENRAWSDLLGDASSAAALASLPYSRASMVRSPAALLRRLDEGTCAGCHQTRAIAGFHLLGEERVRSPFNSLATAGSPHFHEDLRWRESALAVALEVRADDVPDAAAKERLVPPRPFTSRGQGAGGYGTTCGLGAAGFEGWGCIPPLTCRSTGAPDLGLCLPPARGPGDACQTASVKPRPGPDGDRVKPGPLEPCSGAADGGAEDAQCSPNGFGFPGGLCSVACDTPGAPRDDTICVDIPSSGYESECFFIPTPIEKCLETHKARRRVRSCDEEHPCRPDFACVAVPGASGGACVPPYFVFQARVDGPMLDRP